MMVSVVEVVVMVCGGVRGWRELMLTFAARLEAEEKQEKQTQPCTMRRREGEA